MLLHCLVRRRIGLRLPDLRGSILHLQIPRPRGLGPGNRMAVRLAEPARSDRGRGVDRVRVRAVALGGRLDGGRFQGLCPDRSPDGGRHGRFSHPPCLFKQSQHGRARKDDQDVRHLPHRRPLQLLRGAARHVRLQAYVLVHLDHGRQQLGLVAQWLVLPFRLPVRLMDHD